MAAKKSVILYVGLGLLVMGTIQLLSLLGFIYIASIWAMPVIVTLVGILVAVNGKRITQALGWICVIYGIALLLMNTGLFHSPFLWKINPLTWILFGLILIL
jgi:hypothetical protein